MSAVLSEGLPEQDAKSELTVHPQWVFKLDKRDSLLVLKGLGGRLNTPELVEAANALCDRLTLQRAAVMREQLRGFEFLERVVQEKQQ